MQRSISIIRAIAAALALCTSFAWSQVSSDVQQLQTRWAEIKYQLPEKQQAAEFEKLAAQADAAIVAAPNDAGAHIWAGIIRSTWAGAKGGLGALSLVKAAKKHLEHALAIDPNALDGSAHTSLGSLYYQVPGWPVGFGDEDKAREHLEQALTINPNGIDSNYFYADFLYQQKDYNAAAVAATRALAAPARPGREVADAGRRDEINKLLAKIEEKRR